MMKLINLLNACGVLPSPASCHEEFHIICILSHGNCLFHTQSINSGTLYSFLHAADVDLCHVGCLFFRMKRHGQFSYFLHGSDLLLPFSILLYPWDVGTEFTVLKTKEHCDSVLYKSFHRIINYKPNISLPKKDTSPPTQKLHDFKGMTFKGDYWNQCKSVTPLSAVPASVGFNSGGKKKS